MSGSASPPRWPTNPNPPPGPGYGGYAGRTCSTSSPPHSRGRDRGGGCTTSFRLYAEHLTPDQNTAGFTRVLHHYRHTADLAARRFSALPAGQVPAAFATPEDATAWFLQERAGLVACTVHAAATHPEHAFRLSVDLAAFMELDRNRYHRPGRAAQPHRRLTTHQTRHRGLPQVWAWKERL